MSYGKTPEGGSSLDHQRSASERPFFIGGCHSWRTDGPIVARCFRSLRPCLLPKTRRLRRARPSRADWLWQAGSPIRRKPMHRRARPFWRDRISTDAVRTMRIGKCAAATLAVSGFSLISRYTHPFQYLARGGIRGRPSIL
jgi:hypothetical protein